MVTAAVAGAMVTIGLYTAALGWRGRSAAPRIRINRRSWREYTDDRAVRGAAAVAVGLAVLGLSGWVVPAFAAAAGVGLGPAWWRHRHDVVNERARIEAVAAWTEMLRDAVSSGRGVQEAIAVTAPLSPAAIRPAVLALRARSVRGALPTALRTFAEEVGDPMADLVAAALILAATREVRELADLLGALAQTTRQRAALRLAADASRAGLRTTAKAIGAVTAAAAAAMFALQPSYLAPYSTPVGQLVLTAACGWFLLGFWGLSRLGRPTPPRRLSLREMQP